MHSGWDTAGRGMLRLARMSAPDSKADYQKVCSGAASAASVDREAAASPVIPPEDAGVVAVNPSARHRRGQRERSIAALAFFRVNAEIAEGDRFSARARDSLAQSMGSKIDLV